jgi:hypothetical protein
MLRALRRGAELAKQHEEQLKAQRAEQKQQQQQHAAAVGAAEAAADAPVEGEGEGEGGKPKSHKKPRDSAVQEALERYVQAELQEAPPAVAHVSQRGWLGGGGGLHGGAHIVILLGARCRGHAAPSTPTKQAACDRSRSS